MSIFKKNKNVYIEEWKKKVLKLHNDAEFLFYINDAYIRGEYGQIVEGVGAIGSADITDTFSIYSAQGEYVCELHIRDAYVGDNEVKVIEAMDKKVSFYPTETDDRLMAGQLMIILEKNLLEENADGRDN